MQTKGGNEVQPGQLWRRPAGDQLEVLAFDGPTVEVNIKAKAGASIVAAGAEHIDKFDGYVLLTRFRVVISGTPATTIMKGLGPALVGYSAGGQPQQGAVGPPTYEAEVLAADAADAEAMIVSAGGADVDVVSVTPA